MHNLGTEPQQGGDVTRMLQRWRHGESAALDELTPVVYDQLRRIAGRCMQHEREGHTISPTALVNEAFVSLIRAEVDWRDRAHFFAVAARMMRRILVDHAKSLHRARRGGPGLQLVPLDEQRDALPEFAMRPEIVDLDEALERLAALDPQKASMVDMVYFGGLTLAEAAEVTGVSEPTVFRHLRMATAWLHTQLCAEGVRPDDA